MSLFTFPHVTFLLVAIALGFIAVYALARLRAARQSAPAAHRAKGKTSHRGTSRTYRLGGVIAGLLTKDTEPPARRACISHRHGRSVVHAKGSGAYGIRTRDLLNAIEALYQLS